MKDRELLELAAKAIFSEMASQMLDSGWNPLADDGDALRLAVKLGIDIGFGFNGDTPVCVIINSEPTYMEQTDPHAATRRAIVRAAAEITASPVPTFI